MEAEAAKLIGAGIAVIALAGVGVGIGNIFASLITNRMIFRNSSVPNPSRELSNTSSIINKFVLTEFFILATSLQVNKSARSILIFSPSEKEA